MRHASILSLITVVALVATGCGRAELQARELGGIERLHVWNDVWLSSQPQSSDLALLRMSGVRTVLDLRAENEDRGFDEADRTRALGLNYVSIPIASAEDLTKKRLRDIRGEIARAEKPVLVHCASANRVGAIWYVCRRLGGGIADRASEATALDEAHRVGLASEALETRVREYVENERAGESRRGPTLDDKAPRIEEFPPPASESGPNEAVLDELEQPAEASIVEAAFDSTG